MNVKFWKRRPSSDEQPQHHTDAAPQQSTFNHRKHQKLVWREARLCVTVPQKAVEALHISTKRFFEWQPGKKELVGTLKMSETALTTRVELLSHKEQYLAIIPPLYSQQYDEESGKDEKATAIFEWDDTSLQLRVSLKKAVKGKKKKR
ncbi:hypothetical protein CSA56_12645 [candidate division KSB3 bacterium]|uniref:Uncharacterized protein n=1 Tax=candidate division KSB3 bacterium TaxID=2044937 RepID=A0A2G6KDY6_9BACT|nr:MAG: hypothetical protein CSA56_12645 [candidate division KSB3 bacterium]